MGNIGFFSRRISMMKQLVKPTMLSKLKPFVIMGLVAVTVLPLTACNRYLATNIPTGGYGSMPTERTIAQRVLDTSIEHTAKVNIYGLGPEYKQKTRIKFDSYFSDVLVTGYVPNQQMKDEITKVIKSMPDVKKVYNELWVSPPLNYTSVVSGNMIVANVKRELLGVSGLPSNQLHFVYYQDVLYVMGRATPQQRQKLLDTLQNSRGVSKVVDLIQLISETGMPLDSSQITSEAPDKTPVKTVVTTVTTPQPPESIAHLQPAPPQSTPASSQSQFVEYYSKNPEKFN